MLILLESHCKQVAVLSDGVNDFYPWNFGFSTAINMRIIAVLDVSRVVW
jgi:uncharacterized protein (DUF1015 family)